MSSGEFWEELCTRCLVNPYFFQILIHKNAQFLLFLWIELGISVDKVHSFGDFCV